MPNTPELSEAKRALLEKYLRGDQPRTATSESAISRCISGNTAPLSFGQQQVWLLARLMPEVPVYNECVTIHLPGPLDVEALAWSFNEVMRRHEAWRTSFPVVDGLPVQLIHPAPTFKLQAVDLRHLPQDEREAEALRLATEDAKILFDLARFPLLRAKLIRLGDEEHRLFLTLHHIIFDGVAIYQVFLPELRAFYEAFLAGQPSPLPEMPIQYSDYALWQRDQLQGDALSNQLSYWKQQLAGAPASLELPTDRSRPPIQTYHGSMRQFALSRRLTDALKAMSSRQGVTLYMTLVAAFNTLLYRYTGQDDLLIGTATAGRKRPELQKLMGFFLNTLVLRTNLSGNPTFSELLERVRDVVISAIAHEDVPFEYLVKELRPERNTGLNPLFQVLLTLEPPLPALPSGWTLTQMDVTVGTSKFDLSLELDDRPEGLIGRFEYNTDLFDAATIDRIVGHWQTLIEAIAANPTQRLAELPLLTEAERQQELIEWNTTRTPYPLDTCIHQLIEDQVKRTPDNIAVIYEDTRLTYRELNARANQLAHYLRQTGVGSEVLVGLCVERSLDMIVGLLGILKAGGAYVPLDPTFPHERLAFMLEDSQAPVLVTQQHLATQLPRQATQVICLDADEEMLEQQSAADPIPTATGDNLAYVIYTSGSTGRPKGVQVLHRAVVNFMMSMGKEPGLAAEDILLSVTTLSFDIAALELFLPLMMGARLIIAGRDTVANGEALAETLTRTQATVMQATPITWRILLAAGWQGNQRLKILCGGEALPQELARQLLPKTASLWNMYGPTETTIWSTICKLDPGDRSISVGRPIANTQIYLLDAHAQPVPVGVSGELHIGGAGLARGYLNRPDLTAERFIPDPFSDEPGVRLYRTGDLARYRPDGTIELIGRLDHQVKLRGFRIELGEIEAVLGQHFSVRQAIVVAREDAPGDKRLVAYIVLNKGKSVTNRDLQSHAMRQLPAYMIPSAFVLLEALPQTPNGKVDRGALPAPEPARRMTEETYAAPTRTAHYQLLQIWAELLDARPIGIRDNFFYLGGHSLLAARLVDRIEQVFKKKIPLSILFAGPTVEQLCDALLKEDAVPFDLSAKEDASSRAPVVMVQAGGSRQPFFFLHGNWDMNSFYPFALARGLGSDQPFYVLEPYRFDGLQAAPTFETMAAAHVESMRAVQPEGPYLLGGFCAGGVIAFEMARQLRAQGQAVGLPVLIEAGAAPLFLRLLCGFIRCIGRLARLGPDKQLDLFLRLRHVLRCARYKEMRRFSLFPTIEVLRQDGTGIYTWVAAGYIHRPYPGKVIFFWADEKGNRRRAVWGKVNTKSEQEGEIHVIHGEHFSLISENLHIMSAQLKERLDMQQIPAVSPEEHIVLERRG